MEKHWIIQDPIFRLTLISLNEEELMEWRRVWVERLELDVETRRCRAAVQAIDWQLEEKYGRGS